MQFNFTNCQNRQNFEKDSISLSKFFSSFKMILLTRQTLIKDFLSSEILGILYSIHYFIIFGTLKFENLRIRVLYLVKQVS